MKRITMTKNDDLTIEQAFELFIRKATVRNLSQNTIRVYGYHGKGIKENQGNLQGA